MQDADDAHLTTAQRDHHAVRADLPVEEEETYFLIMIGPARHFSFRGNTESAAILSGLQMPCLVKSIFGADCTAVRRPSQGRFVKDPAKIFG
jgi:hypothetical protein